MSAATADDPRETSDTQRPQGYCYADCIEIRGAVIDGVWREWIEREWTIAPLGAEGAASS